MPPTTSARLRKLVSPTTWMAVAGDSVWHLRGACSPPAGVDAEPVGNVAIEWPDTYQHRNAAPFVQAIERAFTAIANLKHAPIPQAHEGIVVLTMDGGDGPNRVAIDYFDFTHVNERCAATVDVYFKMQYRRGGYGDRWEHVVPGGYVTSSAFLYGNWCRLRALHRRRRPRADVFGRFGLRYSADVRSRALDLLSHDPRFEFSGGTRPTRHSWYLREMARAGVCVDLPGQGPFCYRLVECLAMGCCIIGPRHATTLPVDLRPGTEIVYCAEDLSDLPDLCAQYSQDHIATERIGLAAAEYFDQHLHPVQLTRYYIDQVRRIAQSTT